MTRKMKKFASLFLAVVMLVSCFTFTGSAAEAAIGSEAMSVGLALSAESANPGDIITVTISISNNYNATAMRWPVLYSKDFFEVVDGSATAPIDSVVTTAGSTTYGDNSGFIPAAYADSHSAYVIQWFAKAADGVMGAYNSGVAAECFTFQLKVLDTASGSGTVFIPANSEYFYDSAITDPADITLENLYEATNLQVTVSDAATVAVASAAEPELVATEGYSVRTIQFDGDDATYLCGFDLAAFESGISYEEQFTVNNGSYTISGDWGTGAEFTVLDSMGEVFASYKIIFFGDLSGDGMIDISDVSNMDSFVSGDLDSTENAVYYYASDIVPEAETFANVDITDISLLDLYISGDAEISEISQTHIPA
ncbi:MAG: hypothetical protein IKK85_01005 [Clostridia bacterium]|nr:hypothetical protein [Clostridia bacterium]